jgi:hypothetical protein
MLITLRKAVNLRNDIEKFVVTNKIQSSVTVSVYATNIVECLEDYVSSQREFYPKLGLTFPRFPIKIYC